MTDISKCFNGCKRSDRCYRFSAPSHPYRQSYADFKPDPETGECEHFWDRATRELQINHNED